MKKEKGIEELDTSAAAEQRPEVGDQRPVAEATAEALATAEADGPALQPITPVRLGDLGLAPAGKTVSTVRIEGDQATLGSLTGRPKWTGALADLPEAITKQLSTIKSE